MDTNSSNDNPKGGTDNISLNMDLLLKEANDAKAILMTPVIVILGVFMILGVFGNTLVCYYYAFRTRRTSYTVFILVVAAYDLLLCSLSIPIEILDIRFFYAFPNRGACKIMRFCNYFGAAGSVYTLIVISVDRYRKICKPFKNQLGLRETKIATAFSFLVAVIFAWPALVVYDTVSVEIHTESGIPVNGSDCTTIRDPSFSLYILIFNVINLLCFIISTVILSVLYGLVGCVLYKHRQRKQKLHTKESTWNSGFGRHDVQLTSYRRKKSLKENSDVSEAETNTHVSEEHDKQKSDKHGHLDLKSVKFTMMMIVITVVFVVSFLPHLSILVWRAFLGHYEGDSLSDAQLLALNIGIRSYFLNSVINPFTYGFFNPKFRHFFKNTVCLCKVKQAIEGSTVSTSSTVAYGHKAGSNLQSDASHLG